MFNQQELYDFYENAIRLLVVAMFLETLII